MSVAEVTRTVSPDTPLPAKSVTSPCIPVELQFFAPPACAPTYIAPASGVGILPVRVGVDVGLAAVVAVAAGVVLGGKMVISGDGTTGGGNGVGDAGLTVGTAIGVAVGVGDGSGVNVGVTAGGGGKVGSKSGPDGA